MQFLLEGGGDPNVANKQGTTPLHSAVAAKEENLSTVMALVAAGAKLDVMDHQALTPVRKAGLRAPRETYEWLVDKSGGKEPKAVFPEGHERPDAQRTTAELLEDLSARPQPRRARIGRLLDSLSTTADDVPQRIALWLVDDPTIWLAILASEKVEHRRAAHKQLEKLLAMKIDFDPEADIVVRQPQVEALRRRMAP